MKVESRNRRSARGVLCFWGCSAALVVASCAGRTESLSSGNTNWLACDTDSQCGSLTCQCHACMKRCDGQLDCGRPLEQVCVAASAGPADSGTQSSGSGGSSGSGSAANTGSNGATSSSVTSGSAGAFNANQCTGACCPTDPSCYSSALGANAPGAECLAIHDNTGSSRIQMRQTWVRDMTPKGNRIPIVYGNANNYTSLNDPVCNTPGGTSGYLAAFDLDLATGDGRFGFSSFVTDTAGTKANGLCLVEQGTPGWTDVAVYNGTAMDFSLPASEMSPSAGYPPGLPAPMPQPWASAPTRAKRVTADFDVTKDRTALLAHFDPTNGDFASAGYTGVYYYDARTGFLHAYSPLTWQVMYDAVLAGSTSPTSFVLMPLREAEFKATFNDPAHPDCVGRLRVEGLDPGAGCIPDYRDPTQPPWQGWPGVDDTLGEGSANLHGYFLITELEQIFSSVLQSTLCVSFPTAAQSMTDGWATSSDKRCRAPTNTKHWNPSDPVNGLPNGDWCAATNSPATANCHDAYQSVSFHAFQGFKVRDANCAPL